DPVALERGDEVPGRVPRLRVHAGGRLVEKHQIRTAENGGGQRQALLLPAGQPLVRGLGVSGQAHDVKEPRRVVWFHMEPTERPEVLPGRYGGRNAARLEHHADPGLKFGGVPGRVEAEDAHRPRVGAAVAFADLDRGGLARAVGPEDRGDLAAARGEAQPVDGGRRAVPLDHAGEFHGGTRLGTGRNRGRTTHARSLWVTARCRTAWVRHSVVEAPGLHLRPWAISVEITARSV